MVRFMKRLFNKNVFKYRITLFTVLFSMKNKDLAESTLPLMGGFQLLDLIIPELKSTVIPYKFKSSHWLKLQHSDWRANLVKDFFLQMNFPPMRAL